MALGAAGDLAGLAGMGDPIVTCTLNSRNRHALIGQGMPVQQAIQEIGAVVEGYYAVDSARELAKRAGVEMPITQAAYQCSMRNTPRRCSRSSCREKRHEMEETRI
ncbi:MAG: NAD(P)H-dependent glycerol-3-phosphate dehydrogenase [Evtepia gabavorous]